MLTTKQMLEKAKAPERVWKECVQLLEGDVAVMVEIDRSGIAHWSIMPADSKVWTKVSRYYVDCMLQWTMAA